MSDKIHFQFIAIFIDVLKMIDIWDCGCIAFKTVWIYYDLPELIVQISR